MQFLKLATVMMTLLLLVAACGQEQPVQTPLTEAPYFSSLAEGQAAVADTDKYLIIDFYSDL